MYNKTKVRGKTPAYILHRLKGPVLKKSRIFNPLFEARCKDAGFSFLLKAMTILHRSYVWIKVQRGELKCLIFQKCFRN